MEKIILDTNILIEILKSNKEILQKLKATDAVYAISSISAIKNQNIKLYTLNTKDFRFIDGLTLL